MSTIKCPRCRGTGSHSHRFGVLTHERIDELGDDFMDLYASGALDEPCEVCDGNGFASVERIDAERERRYLEECGA
jgi:hypothetical protein